MKESSIGELIKSLRKAKGLTQYRLAKESGIEQSYLTQLESGKTFSITLRIAEKLAKGFDMTLGAFLDTMSTENEDIRKFLIDELPELDDTEKEWLRRTINMVRERKNERQKYQVEDV